MSPSDGLKRGAEQTALSPIFNRLCAIMDQPAESFRFGIRAMAFLTPADYRFFLIASILDS